MKPKIKAVYQGILILLITFGTLLLFYILVNGITRTNIIVYHDKILKEKYDEYKFNSTDHYFIFTDNTYQKVSLDNYLSFNVGDTLDITIEE